MAAFMNVGPTKVYNQRRRYSDLLHRKLFRFTKENLHWLVDYFLDDDTETRGGALSPTQKMEVFLRTLGDPGFQQGVGVDVGVNQSNVSRSLVLVSEAIFSKRDNWIQFPNTDELLAVAMNEWSKQIPMVIGAIDCTHIKITKPSIHGDEYVNRKGICSINVQATCNANEMFTSVDASWPGSVHDSGIWRNSVVHGIMHSNMQGATLLGDEGYEIAPWMLAPFKNPTTAIERNYNFIHARERVIIERCFGQLKRRFPMLNYTIRLKTDRILKYIVSAFVIHNIAKHLQDPDNDFDTIELEVQHRDEQIFEGNQVQIRNQGTQRRNDVAEAIFYNAIN